MDGLGITPFFFSLFLFFFFGSRLFFPYCTAYFAVLIRRVERDQRDTNQTRPGWSSWPRPPYSITDRQVAVEIKLVIFIV